MTKTKSSVTQDGSIGSTMEMARRIWLAGLGAFAATEDKGEKLFKKLVKEGKKIESDTRQIAGRKVEAVIHTVENTVEDVKDRAADTWDGIEQLLEDRITRVLIRFGVPTNEDIQELLERVENLNDNIRTLLEKEKTQ